MSQSLVKNYMHIVFHTKGILPAISSDIESELHAFLGGICSDLECLPIAIGGYYDHVHILCMLSKKIALMSLLKELKASSSLWIKRKSPAFRDFYWQDGYGAFSVSHHETEKVKAYISNQHEHHQTHSYEDELRQLFKENGVVFDERYVWD